MATVSLVHWTYRANKAGKYPVKIAINHGETRRVYAIKLKGHRKNLSLSEKEFEEAKRFRSTIGKELKNELSRAEDAMPKPFSWVRFEAVYTHLGKSFFTYFQEHLEKLKPTRAGTYSSYLNALNKWKSLVEDFPPIELFGQLHKLEASCKTKSTAGIYLRATRVVYNIIRKDFPEYPVWSFRINSKVNTHKARTLTREELKSFASIKVLTPAQEDARRIFMISYFCGGMNMADILNLKWTDIKKDRIVFIREKTKSTNPTPIELPINDNLKKYLGKKDLSPYVIEDFNRTGTLLEISNRIKSFTKNINTRLKAICINNKIEPFTTYAARHTFASQLKFNGISTSLISELLGHSSVLTTEAYLRRFEIEKKAEALKTIDLDNQE